MGTLNEQQLWNACRQVISSVFEINASELDFEETHLGSFNRIFKFSLNQQNYAFRIRVNDAHFGFEKVCKEVFAAIALETDSADDQKLATAYSRLLTDNNASTINNKYVGVIRYADWSKSNPTLPFPYSINEWKDGEILYNHPEKHLFQNAGALLAKLHSTQFAHCYGNILNIGKEPQALLDITRQVVTASLQRCIELGTDKLLASSTLQWLEDRLSLAKYEPITPVFCHYDFSGSNLIVSPQNESTPLSVIDFDNWKISIAEEDFPKLLHWTIVHPDTQKRIPCNQRIEAFTESYIKSGGSINHSLLEIKEVEWLTRVYAHSLHCENDDKLTYERSSFPPSEYYAQTIAQKIGQ